MHRVLVWAAAALLAAAGPLEAQRPEIRVDPRVELLSLIFRLAGNPEYNMCRFPRYQQAADAWFAPWREHRAVGLARQARQTAGVGFDAVQSFAIHLGPLPELAARRPLRDTANALESRWRRVDAEGFREAVQAFARESRFTEFLASQQAVADSVVTRLERLFSAEVDFSWFERFFGARPAARFQLTPGLCNGAGNFGPRYVAADGTEELYAIVGVFGVDSVGIPTFTRGMVPTIVHEFNHSYVNPVFNTVAARFEPAYTAIYPHVAEEMRAQAYGNGLTMLNESMVRAGVVRYLAATQGDAAARQETAQQVGLGFVWMEELAERMAEYERQRDRYPTLASYVPRLAAYWDSLAPRVPDLLRALDARRPQLVAMEPADGATGVDPTITRVVFRFDRPMGRGYAINPGPGGDATFPEFQSLTWDSTRTVLTGTVQLVAGRAYALILSGRGFRSADGVPLGQRTVRFTTR